jgi:hypothetical protein
VKASLENAVNYAKLTAFFYPFYPKEEHMTNEKIAKEEAILAKRKEQAKFGKQWVISTEAMKREYGIPKAN